MYDIDSVLVLEKSFETDSPLKKLPFGIRGLSAPTIESLDRRGLLRELQVHKTLKSPHTHQEQLKPGRAQVGHFAGIPFIEKNIDRSEWNRLPSSTPTSLISEIDELEKIFLRRAGSLGVEILRGCPTTAVQQNETGVVVRSLDQSFESKWLVGCDGGRSSVRKLTGFDFAGTEPEFTGYTVRADVKDPEKLQVGRVMTETGMYMQSQPGYLVIQNFDKGAFHGSGLPVTLAHAQEVLRRVSGTDVTLSQIHTATTWTDRARQATKYRIGRVLLAGDAAHIHSPLGGQGLNLGLGDAMNLGWKLLAVVRNVAAANLLDSYEIERRPVGEKVLEWSRAQVAIMNPSASARALHSIFRDLIDTEDGATYFAKRVWGIDLRIDLGELHPLVGQSVPNFELQNGTFLNEAFQDGCALLIDFQKSDQLQYLGSAFEEHVKYLRVEPESDLKALFVRPDGIIAWATTDEVNEASLLLSLKKYFLAQRDEREPV